MQKMNDDRIFIFLIKVKKRFFIKNVKEVKERVKIFFIFFSRARNAKGER